MTRLCCTTDKSGLVHSGGPTNDEIGDAAKTAYTIVVIVWQPLQEYILVEANVGKVLQPLQGIWRAKLRLRLPTSMNPDPWACWSSYGASAATYH